MRFAAAAVIALDLSCWGCTGRPPLPVRAAVPPSAVPPSAVPPSAAPVTSASRAPDVFAQDVAPLLAKKCTPCHVPGGRMYGRLPFDDPGTVRGAKDGILRRLKDPEERAVVEGWLASQPQE